MIGLIVVFFGMVLLLVAVGVPSSVAVWVVVAGGILSIVLRKATRTTKTGVAFRELCPECGKHVGHNARICPYCRTWLVRQ